MVFNRPKNSASAKNNPEKLQKSWNTRRLKNLSNHTDWKGVQKIVTCESNLYTNISFTQSGHQDSLFKKNLTQIKYRRKKYGFHFYF